MNEQRQILALRISLVTAMATGAAILVMAHLHLRPQIQKLGQERQQFERLSDQRLARAIKAETDGRELAEQLADRQSQLDAAPAENKRLLESNAQLLVGMEEGRAKLLSAKQELARWNATGATPEQVSSLAHENKTLATKASQLEKERDQLGREYANLKLRLDPPSSDEDAIPVLPPIKGSVLVVDPKWNFVVLDIGENEGLRNRGVLMISREGKLVGKVKVRHVDSQRSIADILPGWSVSAVREGDQVIN